MAQTGSETDGIDIRIPRCGSRLCGSDYYWYNNSHGYEHDEGQGNKEAIPPNFGPAVYVDIISKVLRSAMVPICRISIVLA